MRYVLSLLFICSLPVSLLCQAGAQAGAAQASPTIHAPSEEVLLDVVVRDKKGRRLDDLKPDDFRVFDNGEAKKISSFRLVQGGEALGAGGTRTQLDPLRQIRLVSMIFQCSDTNAGRLAHDAAMDLLKGELPQNVYLAVMAIDHKLEVLQPFTNDLDALRRAIERATRSPSADFSKDTETVRRQLEEMLGPNTTGAQSLQGQINNIPTTTPGQPAPSGTGLANVAMAQMLLEMIQTEQSYAMSESGRTSIYSLLDAVKQQYRLPGRKTILYFSEGFVVPLGLEDEFKQTISIANRSNVSFYTVDAQGLGTVSTNKAAIDMSRSAAQTSRDQATAGSDVPVRPDEVHLFDTTIMSTRANTQSALEALADSTGGALIANTNDLRTPLRRLAEDIQTYYEISYNPEIKTYDGSFRKITIKMSSPDLRVQSRSGYIALPPSLGAGNALRAFEVPLLTALSSPEPPRAFDFEAATMHFRGPQGQPVSELVVDVPLSAVTLEKQTDEFSGTLSYVVLLKDAQGGVVKKFQNQIPVSAPAAKLEALKASHFIYTEHFDLPPGTYTVEAAVLDGAGNRISARKSILTVPPPATTLALSSVAFIRTTKERPASSQDGDPMAVGAKLISPMLKPVISKQEMPALPFYVVIYPDKTVASAPQLEMEFSRDGKVLGRGPAQLGTPDRDGRIPLVANVPLARLEPGAFTLRFVVKQGSEAAEESASFALR